MPDMHEKLNYFTTTVLTEATRESEALLDEIEARRAAALRAAENDALRESYALIQEGAARIRAETGCRIAAHRMEARRALALRREALTDGVFARAAERADAFTKTPEYAAHLAALFRDAAARLPEGAALTILLRAADMPLAGRVVGSATGVTVAPGDFTLGGLVVECLSAGLRVDATFDRAAEALRAEFSALSGLTVSTEV